MKNKISGKTNVYGIIGDPISHSFSPIMHNFMSEMFEVDAAYLPFRVNENELEHAILGAYALKIKGLNVTIPHKNNVMKYLTALDESALLVGSVNTLKYEENGYIGYNTDYIGIYRTLKNHDVNLKDKNIVIFGGGGSSYAAVIAACQFSPRKIYIVNRTKENGLKIANHVKTKCTVDIEVLTTEKLYLIENPQIVIQTTSLGFGKTKDLSPVCSENFFEKISFALDIIYSPWETVFLKDAKKCGVKCTNGFDVLVYQGLASYEIWNDMKFSKQEEKRIYNKIKEVFKCQV